MKQRRKLTLERLALVLVLSLYVAILGSLIAYCFLAGTGKSKIASDKKIVVERALKVPPQNR